MTILKLIHIANKPLPSLKVHDPSSCAIFFPVELVNSIFDKHLFLGTFSMNKCGTPHNRFLFRSTGGAHAIRHPFVGVSWVKLSLTLGHLRLVEAWSTRFIEISCSMISNILWLIYFRGSLSYIMKFLWPFKTIPCLQWIIS